ncbi:sensor histidine kinase [Lentzea sp. NBRC 102530]|uniref:sensor histidine kinase n=1 Tax=Lentzea sp. NBRC 102530 TaxID=3032201 RepID=UPI0024A02B51|nr:sensor histidine kinase [Lentzea sp. NBRC 102530]GLY47318.1 two-component sensor histidine kinase [Lentzea sp. NBRC 102530]
MVFAEIRQFLVTGLATVFGVGRLERAPSPAPWHHVRVSFTVGAAVLVFILDLVNPPGRYGWDYPVNGWWFTAVAAATVLLTLVRPLWAWRVAVLLLTVTPQINWGWSDDWLWPWSPGLVLASLTVLLTVGQNYRQMVLVWVFAVTTGLVWLLFWGYLPYMLMICAIIGAPLVLGNAMRLRRVADADRAEQRTRADTLEERAVIARELHDVVAHHMSVLALRAGSARYRFTDVPPDLVTEFDEMQSTAREGLTEMRRLLGVLRNSDGVLDTAPQPRVEEIADLVERLRGAGVSISLQTDGDTVHVPDGVALSAYRIVQEALSNAVRHAPGSDVDVRITALAAELRLVVANSAATEPAAPADERPRHGLLGMKERVTALRGTFRAETEGNGFVVAVTLPLNGNEG